MQLQIAAAFFHQLVIEKMYHISELTEIRFVTKYHYEEIDQRPTCQIRRTHGGTIAIYGHANYD
jgi:hypothetical protein